MSAKRFLVTGLVQGVFYRAKTKEKADELGVTGWVRNNTDGSVTVHAEGTEEQVKALEDWCWTGPPKAKVTAVQVAPDQESQSQRFEIFYQDGAAE